MQNPNLTGSISQETIDQMDAEEYPYFLAYDELLDPKKSDEDYHNYIESHRLYDL